jgi:hypothetical protein
MSDTQTATAPAPPSDPIAAMSPDERQQWRLTGDLPGTTPDPSTTPADSSPAAPAAQVESTDSSIPPASEPGTSAKPSKVKARSAELDAEIAALNDKLSTRARLRAQLSEPDPTPSVSRPSDATPAASSPATVAPLDQLLKSPDLSRPPLEDAEFFAAYPQATLGQFSRYQTRYETLAMQREHSAASQVTTRIRSFVERRNAALQERPTLMADLDPRVATLTPIDALPPGTAPTALNLVAQEIVESDQAVALMQYLSDHPEVYDRLASAPSRDVILREMGRIEALASQPVSPSRVVSPKTTTSAPSPTTSLGSRPTGTTDAAAAAIGAQDFGRYRAEMNDRDRKGAS